jgi:hypothetical protein
MRSRFALACSLSQVSLKGALRLTATSKVFWPPAPFQTSKLSVHWFAADGSLLPKTASISAANSNLFLWEQAEDCLRRPLSMKTAAARSERKPFLNWALGPIPPCVRWLKFELSTLARRAVSARHLSRRQAFERAGFQLLRASSTLILVCCASPSTKRSSSLRLQLKAEMIIEKV